MLGWGMMVKMGSEVGSLVNGWMGGWMGGFIYTCQKWVRDSL